MLTSNGYTNAWYTGSLDLAGGVIDDIWHNYIMACLENTGFCKAPPGSGPFDPSGPTHWSDAGAGVSRDERPF